MGCLFFLSHLWHFASSYPNRPSTDIGGLAICFFFFFLAYLCICFFHSFCMPSILIPCARVGGFTIIPYIYAFLIPEHSLNLSFHLFLVSKFLQCTFFHSPSFFHHSFVLVCLLHLGDPLNLYFRLVHFRLVCLGRTRGWPGLVPGFCNI